MRAAFGFLTTLGTSAAPNPKAMQWFPIVGLVLGAMLGGVWLGADALWPPLVAAVLVVSVDLALTGMLHLDGLADAADGLLPPVDRERRLAIMKAPDIGAFGTAVVVMTLLLRVAGLTELVVEPLLLVLLWCASRSVMAIVPAFMTYARSDGGLASAFLDDRPSKLPALWIAAAAIAGWLVVGPEAAVGVAGVMIGAAAVLALAQRRIGGFTGDIIGAAAVIGETTGLLLTLAVAGTST